MIRPRVAGGQVLLGDLLGAAPGLLANLASTVAPRPLHDAPTFVTWALTERCPLTCQHCDMGAATPELDRKQRIALAHQLASSGVWGVSLIGGEPTLVPELGDLAAILAEAGTLVSLGTSGRRLGRHLPWILALGIDQVTLSVDSHDAAAHDRFRGRPGLFAEVLEAAQILRNERRGAKPQVQIRATIHRGNFQALMELVDFWGPRVDNVLLQVVQNNGIHAVRDTGTLFQPEDRPALEASLAALQQAHPALRSPYLALAARYIFEPEALYRDIGFRCLLVPAATATILPDGRLTLCYGRPDALVGSLLESSLSALWTSAATQRIRRAMQSRDYGCMCWEQACSGNLGLVSAGRAVDRVRAWVRGA